MIKFIASLADITNPIKVKKDGMQLTLDVPETQLPNAIRIINMRKK